MSNIDERTAIATEEAFVSLTRQRDELLNALEDMYKMVRFDEEYAFNRERRVARDVLRNNGRFYK